MPTADTAFMQCQLERSLSIENESIFTPCFVSNDLFISDLQPLSILQTLCILLLLKFARKPELRQLRLSYPSTSLYSYVNRPSHHSKCFISVDIKKTSLFQHGIQSIRPGRTESIDTAVRCSMVASMTI